MTDDADDIRHFYIHLISDATGTTLQSLARACLAQFDRIDPIERFWPLVRSKKQLDRVLVDVAENPGPVLFTIVDKNLREQLQDFCHENNLPCLAVLDPLIKGLSSYLGLPSKGIPGLQHALDEAYFKRIESVDFALFYDDGQHLEGLERADVVLVGVSRTSKTPTCIYLARRGIKAANIPFVPGVPFPEHATKVDGPLFIGLTESPERLVQLRHSRLKMEEQNVIASHGENSYLDIERVIEETKEARRFFTKQKWPVIDVTRRSVEETATEIQILLRNRNAAKAQ